MTEPTAAAAAGELLKGLLKAAQENDEDPSPARARCWESEAPAHRKSAEGQDGHSTVKRLGLLPLGPYRAQQRQDAATADVQRNALLFEMMDLLVDHGGADIDPIGAT